MDQDYEFDEHEMEPRPAGRYAKIPYIMLWVLGGLVLVTGALIRILPMSPGIRVLLLATLGMGVLTLIAFIVRRFADHPGLLYPSFFILALFITWMVLGNKPYNAAALRTAYVKRLTAQQGTKYLEGGETDLGIGESGLARSALWQAMVIEGAREVNPRFLTMEFWRFWWRDIDTPDIISGRYGYTSRILTADKLAGYDSFALEPGDMAVTADSHELLIYLGERKWIQADPEAGKVVLRTATAKSRAPALNTPVSLYRWWVFAR